MELGPESIDQPRVSGIAQRLASGVGANAKFESDRRQEDRSLPDRERVGQPSLDPAVLGR